MSSFLILRDCNVVSLVVDGVDIGNPKKPNPKYKGAFRGFDKVPPGTHRIVAKMHGGDNAKDATLDVDVSPGSVNIFVLNAATGLWDAADEETRKFFVPIALSGSMNQAGALRPWPVVTSTATTVDPSSDARSTTAAMRFPVKEGHIYVEEDIKRLQAAFIHFRTTHNPDQYYENLMFNYIIDFEMAKQGDYFSKLARVIATHLAELPALAHVAPIRSRLEYLVEDMKDVEIPGHEELERALSKAA